MADKSQYVESDTSPPMRITRSAAKSAGKKRAVTQQRQNTNKSNKKPTKQQNTPKKGPRKKLLQTPKSQPRIYRRILEEEDDEEKDNGQTDKNNNDRDHQSDDSLDSDDDNDEDSDYVNHEEEDDDEDDTDASDCSDEEKIITPFALTDDVNVAGGDVFGFQTPLGTQGRSLAQAASQAIHVKKSASSKKYTKIVKKTPQRKREQEKQKTEEETHGKKPRKSVASSSKNNGAALFRRGKAVKQSEADSDDESNSDTSSKSGYVNPNGAESTKKYKQVIADIPEDSRGMVEEYFSVHHDTQCLTSDRTLASLATPLMDHRQISKHLKQVSATHPSECLQFYHEYRKHFDKWLFQIRHGFNLLLYGVGSKRVIIDQFRSSMLQGYTQLVVNGYFPSITVKNILNMITEDVLNYHGSFKNIIDQASFIQDTYRKGKASGELYLIIHNIEGAMLRSKKSQTVLSLLAEIPFIHVIASIDHISAPLVWDQCMCSRFKFLWYDVTTFEPYTEETSYENSLMVQQSGALALSSMSHVMRSLNQNGQNIFLLIAKKQLEEKDNSSYIGYSISDLYSKCREQFLVHSEQTLRAQLTEFRDHKLIRSKKGTDGVEHLIIPIDTSTLKQFLEDQQQNNNNN